MSSAEEKVIRVLVVDDSKVAAELMTHILSSDQRVKVVGVAFDGDEAVEAAQRTSPDVITMDVHMPRVNGYEATRRIMETCPAPIVIVSGSTSAGEVAGNFRAIEAGALAVAQRPNGIGHPHHETQSRELLNMVKLMSEVKVVRRWSRYRMAAASPPQPHIEISKPPGPIRAVVIGASTGGPLVLQSILTRLPKDFAAPILIVQHMTPGFVAGFVEWLARSSGFPVRVAADGDPLTPGQALVAPDKFHMGIGAGHCIHLDANIPENGMRPSVSFLFRSVLKAFGSNVAAVLLSGMGRDGVEELKNLKDAGAVTIVQDKESSVIHGMPGQAIEIGAAAHILPPDRIARMLASLVTNP